MHICNYLLACVKYELLLFEDTGSVKSFGLVINLFYPNKRSLVFFLTS